MSGPLQKQSEDVQVQTKFSTFWSGQLKFGSGSALAYAEMRDPDYKWPNALSMQQWRLSASSLANGRIRISVQYVGDGKTETHDFDPASDPTPVFQVRVQHADQPNRYDLANLLVLSTGPDSVQARMEFSSKCLLSPLSAPDTQNQFLSSNLSAGPMLLLSGRGLEIPFQLQSDAAVSIDLYDLRSAHVASIISSQPHTPGSHSVRFDASSLAPGLYFAILTAGSERRTLKVLLP